MTEQTGQQQQHKGRMGPSIIPPRSDTSNVFVHRMSSSGSPSGRSTSTPRSTARGVSRSPDGRKPSRSTSITRRVQETMADTVAYAARKLAETMAEKSANEVTASSAHGSSQSFYSMLKSTRRRQREVSPYHAAGRTAARDEEDTGMDKSDRISHGVGSASLPLPGIPQVITIFAVQ